MKMQQKKRAEKPLVFLYRKSDCIQNNPPVPHLDDG